MVRFVTWWQQTGTILFIAQLSPTLEDEECTEEEGDRNRFVRGGVTVTASPGERTRGA